MSDVFVPLSTDDDLDRLLVDSSAAPVILFKHSQSCGNSWAAEASLSEGGLPAPVHRLVVQRQRAISDRIAHQLSVRHESPQVIIVVDGKAAWHTSHAGVTRERVAAAWQRLHDARTSAISA